LISGEKGEDRRQVRDKATPGMAFFYHAVVLAPSLEQWRLVEGRWAVAMHALTSFVEYW
jgi:hypothetical protein